MIEKTRIIRCLWGDTEKDCRLSRVWKDVKKAAKRKEQEFVTVYVYGRDNYQTLRGMGFDCFLVNPYAFPDGKRDFNNGNTMQRPWHYKMDLLAAAAAIGPLIYCDWDVSIAYQPTVKQMDQWGLAQKKFALSLYKYRRPHAPSVPRGGEADKLTPSGNWLWINGPEFPWAIRKQMQTALEDQPGHPSSWHDEYAMNEYIDSLHGGWPGTKKWLELYESPIMVQKENRQPWGSWDRAFFKWTKVFYQ